MAFVVVHRLDDLALDVDHPLLSRVRTGVAPHWARRRAGARTWLSWCHPANAWVDRGKPTGDTVILDGFVARPDRVDSCRPGGAPFRLRDALCLHEASTPDLVDGNYALCVINVDGNRVRAVRDRTGARVLYWGQHESLLVISNRADIVATAIDKRGVDDPVYVAHFFAMHPGSAPGRTAFSDVRELLPGTLLDTHGGTVKVTRKPVALAANRQEFTQAQWVEAFFETFKRAVADTIDDHESVAVMLSGGMDSIPILSVARELSRTGRRVVAVSWCLPDFVECDETEWIRSAVDAIGVEHRMFDGGHLLPFARLESNLVLPGVPVLNPFRDLIMACYREAASAGCSVILNGSRGDLIYANRIYLLYDLIRRRDYPGLWHEVAGMIRRIGVLGTVSSPLVRHPLANWIRALRPGPRRIVEWLTPWAREQLVEVRDWPPEASEHPFPSYATALLGTTMSFGPAQENEFASRLNIDRREPFQNAQLVRLMLEAPVTLSHAAGISKRVMREAMRGRIPERLRMKSRTGILNDFLQHGFLANRDAASRQLAHHESRLARYLARVPVVSGTNDAKCPDHDALLVARCIGYCLWRTLAGANPGSGSSSE